MLDVRSAPVTDPNSREVCHCSPGTFQASNGCGARPGRSMGTAASKGLFSCSRTQRGNDVRDHGDVNQTCCQHNVSYLEAELHLQVAVEYTSCSSPTPRIGFCDSLRLCYMTLVSISGILVRLMEVNGIKLGGLGERFSGRNSKTGKVFLWLLIFSWALIFGS